jgi:predicted lipoprotein with Yx(FWY)xxD motif
MKRSITTIAALVAAIAGFALAVVAGGASGRSRTFTLNVAQNGHIKTVPHAIVVNGKGFAVYMLSGESAHHILCVVKTGCLGIWPMVTIGGTAKPTAAPGIKGRLGTLRRTVNGHTVRQVTLGGHPLYTFVQDTKRAVANGNGITHFGGTWHAFLDTGTPASTAPAGSMTTTPTNTSTTPTYTYTTPTYTYSPPGY